MCGKPAAVRHAAASLSSGEHSWEIVVSGRLGRVAQLVEHTLGKGEVIGSIPIASSGGWVVGWVLGDASSQ